MLTLLIAFFSLIVLMIIHEFGHFVIAKKFGVKVEEFGIFYPPRLFGVPIGETLYSVNLIPLGAFVKIYGEEGGVDDYRSFSKLSVWKRILICLGGVLAFWLASIVIFTAVFLIGAQVPIGDQDVAGLGATHVEIMQVQANSPAQLAGMREGDMIIGFSKVADFQKFIEQNKEKEVNVTIERNGQQTTLKIVPRVSYPANEGPTGVALDRFANIIEKTAWYKAPFHGVVYTGKVTWQAVMGIYNVMASLAGGNGVPDGAELAGPVGITIFLSQAANFGVGFFLYFIGSLSVLLALFNVFPIPALDGGKLLFLIIEGVRRKPVSVRIEQSLTIIFFFLLIAMSVFVTIKFDVPRVVDFWKAGL